MVDRWGDICPALGNHSFGSVSVFFGKTQMTNAVVNLHNRIKELEAERDALKAQLEEANKLIANLTEQRDTYVKMANLEAKSEPVAWQHYFTDDRNVLSYSPDSAGFPPIKGDVVTPLYASPQAINQQLLEALKLSLTLIDYLKLDNKGVGMLTPNDFTRIEATARAAIEAAEGVKK